MNYSYKTLKKIKQHIKYGGVIAFPTESTYGLGCDPRNYKAIQKLLLLKKRPLNKGLIVVSNKLTNIQKMVNILHGDCRKMTHYQELHNKQYINHRAISFIGHSKNQVLSILNGRRSTIAFRLINNHKFIDQISNIMPNKLPIIATSANSTGHIPHRKYHDISRVFAKSNKNLLLILRGHGKFYKQTSRIINLITGAIVR